MKIPQPHHYIGFEQDIQERSISIEHSEEHGTNVNIEDPTNSELIALFILVAGLLIGLKLWRKK